MATPGSSSSGRARGTTPPWRASSSSEPTTIPPVPGTARWRLTLAYDGGAFRGFAAQADLPTVAGVLADALQRATRTGAPPPITCAGRTDAGVHARGQVVHVDLPAPLPDVRQPGGGAGTMTPEQLQRSLNRQLAPRVVVRAAEEAPAGFDARRSATARSYRYLVWNAPVPDPLLAAVTWHVAEPLELRAMAGVADAVIGSHDFRAFCRRAPGTSAAQPIVRQVRSAGWSTVPTTAQVGPGRLLRFDVTAGSFCHQMVRSLVAFFVEAGRGRATAADLVERLRSGDRAAMAAPAPPGGLSLESVSY